MKKLLYLEDLYNFYLNQNKTCTFSSKETHEPIIVHVNEKLVFEDTNEDNLRVHLQSCHIGSNLNKSKISEKTMKKAIPSFYNKPILGYIHYCEETESFEFAGHEMRIDKDGNMEYLEIPVGNIPESANPVLKYDKDNDKTYLELDGIIYEDYTKAADILRREKECAVSVELAVDELSFDAEEKVLVIDAFRFTGVTILGRDVDTGEKVMPGMQGANVTIADFSVKENSVCAEEKLIETLDKLNETLKTFNINNEERRNEAMDNKELESVVEEVVEETKEASEEVIVTEEEIKSEETVVETPSEESEENFEETEEVNIEESFKKKKCEVEKQFEEDSEDDVEDDTDESPEGVNEEDISPLPDDETVVPDQVESESESETESEIGLPDDDVRKITHSVEIGNIKKEFSVSLNDVIFALTTLVNDTYGETDCDWYSVNVFDNEKYVEMYGWNKAYRQSYKVKGGNYSLVGDRVEVFAKYLTQDEIHQLENMKANYSSIELELNSYKEKELDTKKMNVFNEKKYENIRNTKQFEELIENRKELSVDEIKTKADKMLEFAKSLFSFNKEEKKSSIVIGMFSNDDREEKKNNPYGNLFKNLKK